MLVQLHGLLKLRNLELPDLVQEVFHDPTNLRQPHPTAHRDERGGTAGGQEWTGGRGGGAGVRRRDGRCLWREAVAAGSRAGVDVE